VNKESVAIVYLLLDEGDCIFFSLEASKADWGSVIAFKLSKV